MCNIKCPFYNGESDGRIFCNNNVLEYEVRINHRKEEYKKMYCECENYKNCTIAKRTENT